MVEEQFFRSPLMNPKPLSVANFDRSRGMSATETKKTKRIDVAACDLSHAEARPAILEEEEINRNRQTTTQSAVRRRRFNQESHARILSTHPNPYGNHTIRCPKETAKTVE